MDAAIPDECCWICLDIASPRRPLVRPCKCPRFAHELCIARWQLRSVGKRCGRMDLRKTRYYVRADAVGLCLLRFSNGAARSLGALTGSLWTCEPIPFVSQVTLIAARTDILRSWNHDLPVMLLTHGSLQWISARGVGAQEAVERLCNRRGTTLTCHDVGFLQLLHADDSILSHQRALPCPAAPLSFA